MHWLAYLCWPVALVHGLGTGTDTTSVVGLALSVGCAASVVAALWWRLSVTRSGPVRTWAAAGSVVLPVLVAAWLLQGPLAPGWAARAGTPSGLLGTTAAASATTADASSAGGLRRGGAGAGALAERRPGRRDLVAQLVVPRDHDHDRWRGWRDDARVRRRAARRRQRHVAVVLQGADDAGSFSVRSGTVTITSPQGTTGFVGRLTAIQGEHPVRVAERAIALRPAGGRPAHQPGPRRRHGERIGARGQQRARQRNASKEGER